MSRGTKSLPVASVHVRVRMLRDGTVRMSVRVSTATRDLERWDRKVPDNITPVGYALNVVGGSFDQAVSDGLNVTRRAMDLARQAEAGS